MKAEIHKEEGYKLMGAAFEVYNAQLWLPSRISVDKRRLTVQSPFSYSV